MNVVSFEPRLESFIVQEQYKLVTDNMKWYLSRPSERFDDKLGLLMQVPYTISDYDLLMIFQKYRLIEAYFVYGIKGIEVPIPFMKKLWTLEDCIGIGSSKTKEEYQFYKTKGWMLKNNYLSDFDNALLEPWSDDYAQKRKRLIQYREQQLK